MTSKVAQPLDGRRDGIISASDQKRKENVLESKQTLTKKTHKRIQCNSLQLAPADQYFVEILE